MEALSIHSTAAPEPTGTPVAKARPRPLSRLSQYVGFTPAAVLFGIFFGAPMVMIVAYSFWTQNGYSIEARWTFANYQTIFSTPVYIDTFLTTLWMTAAATAATLAIAFPFAYWLARYVRRGWQRPLLFLVIIPFWVSYLLRVTSWTIILEITGASLTCWVSSA